MNRKLIYFVSSCILLLASLNMKAQIATEFATDLEVNGIKLGYCYTIEQLKAKFGKVNRLYTWGDGSEEMGSGNEIVFDGISFRLDWRNMILFVSIKTPKYILKPYNMLKIGEPLSKINLVPNVTRKIYHNDEKYVCLYIGKNETDPIVVVYKNNIITNINYEILTF